MKFIKGFLLFLFFNGIIIFLLEIVYNKYENTYDSIFKDIDKNKNLYTDVYIGNSHTMALKENTDNPNAKVLNIATPGQDLFKTYAILKKWVPLLQNVKTIYIGIDYEMLGQNLSLSGLPNEDRQLYKYTDTLYYQNAENILMAKSSFFRANRDLNFLVYKKDVEVNKNYIPPVIQLNEEDCKKRALEHSQIRFKANLIDENVNYIVEIIKMAKANEKQLVIFIPPKSSCFKNNVIANNIQLSKLKLDSILTKANIKYFNFYEDAVFVANDFLDYDHLNTTGVKKLISKINLQIQRN